MHTMITQFLDIKGKDKLAYIYEANGFTPEPEKPKTKKLEDGRVVRRLEDVIDTSPPTQKPLVIMLHDFPDHSDMHALGDLYGMFAKRLKVDGFPTLRFEFRGCGESDGRQQDFSFDEALEDFRAIVKWAQDTHGHDRFAIISAGLSACVLAQAYDANIMSSLVLLWPVFIPMHTPLNVIDTLESRKYMSEHDYVLVNGNKVGQFLANELKNIDVTSLLKRMKTVTQVQQGTADTYTPYTSTDVIKKHLTGLKDFGVFEDGEHYLPDPQMRKQMIDNTLYFLNKYAYRLPPGRVRSIDNAPIFRSRS